MLLHAAFNIVRGEVVAFVGAGGKTSTLIALGYELMEQGWRVLATTTTRIGEGQLALMPQHVHLERGAAQLASVLEQRRFVFVRDEIRGGKVYGLAPEQVAWVLDSLNADVLLIEADGARGLPFKAPHAHEPVIPAETSLVVPIAGMSVLGQPLDAEHVYNAEAMIAHYGFYEGAPVKSPWVAQVLRDEAFGLRGVPPKARVVALLNQTPGEGYARARARLIARLTLRSARIGGVAIGSVREANPILEVQRPVGAVILGAGMSSRMGQMKLLLPWSEGRTILEHIIQQLQLAKVDYITVVTGHRADEVRALAEAQGASVAHNPDFATGEMLSSLQTGLRALPPHIAAALVVLGDQPRLQARVVVQVLTAYAEGAGDIVAPSYEMRRGHPILIDRRYWRDLLSLAPGGAPRDVINANAERVAYVPVQDDSILRDVDTPAEYHEERRRAGLDADESNGDT